MKHHDKPLKIADIARKTGISEEEARDITRRHPKEIPSRRLGRIKVFPEQAVEAVRRIAEKETAADDGSENEPQRKGAPAGANGRSDSRLGAIAQQRQEERKRERASSPGPSSSAVQGAPYHLIEKVALQEKQIQRIFARLEEAENRHLKTATTMEERIALLERQVEALREQNRITGEWIRYVDGRLDEMAAADRSIAETTNAWASYTESELALLKRSFSERLLDRFRHKQ
ncbi:hypothetical protein AZH53_10615 [Methanomicrobiaceae archaeon CYW5]|uniref:hypothetical protein n=1 Tax=Methanovulcanius yangii TaxID=1789227 RepID=UPI0029CA4871|nr:hypothetical protein [Methanovulcanius yangii]MBT8508855.1 hypothetical protein [Methanovulcanius yangii]